MCEPVTLTALAVGAATAGGVGAAGLAVGGLSVAATALAAGSLAMTATQGALGSRNAAQAARDQANYQSAVARNNAIMSERQGEQARLEAANRGNQAAIKAQREAQRLRGAQTVRLAGNGLDLNSGTPLAILEDTDYFGAMDATQLRRNAEREGALQAWGYQNEAANFTASGNMYATAAANSNPRDAMTSSLLSSAAQFGGQYAGAKLGQRMKLNSDIDANIANSGLY